MKYLLCYIEDGLGEAWRHYFAGQPDVEVVYGDICQLDCDAIVSPANSFGFMDGGLDLRLSEFFGWDLEARVRETINQRPLRELLIGEAIVVPTGSSKIPWLIAAPTMRVPMRIRTGINAYLAMKAILIAAREHRDDPAIGRVAISGLGTGIGQLAPEVCASQMWQAYQEIVLGQYEPPDNFATAQKQHALLNRAALIFD